jgi:hypothetical protein
VQGDLVLFLGDLRPVHCLPEVGLGDRLALRADLFVADLLPGLVIVPVVCSIGR